MRQLCRESPLPLAGEGAERMRGGRGKGESSATRPKTLVGSERIALEAHRDLVVI
jgi:hypothetical protein